MIKPKAISVANRKKVRLMSAQGMRIKEIAAVMSVPQKHIREHFRPDVDVGIADRLNAVTANLYAAALDGAPWAIQFYLRSQHGWQDKPDESGTVGNVTINVSTGISRAGDDAKLIEANPKLEAANESDPDYDPVEDESFVAIETEVEQVVENADSSE